MTTTFADYAASAPAREQIADNILKHTLSLCEALRQNYIDYSIRSHRGNLERHPDESVEYHEKCIADLKDGKSNYDFVIESGRKYYKIVMVIDNGPDRSPSRSCHAFINKKSGGVFKSSSWKAPAAGERYNLLLIKDREWALSNADWSGSWLYKR